MVTPLYEVNPAGGECQGDMARLAYQIKMGRARMGREAAREIAERIERQGGFWGPPVSGQEAQK